MFYMGDFIMKSIEILHSTSKDLKTKIVTQQSQQSQVIQI